MVNEPVYGEVDLVVSNISTWFTLDKMTKYLRDRLGWQNVRCFPLWRADRSCRLRSLTYKVRLPVHFAQSLLDESFFPHPISVKPFNNRESGPKFSIPSSVKCYYANAGGMRGKLSDFFASMSETEYDVVAITETWLLPEHKDSEIAPSGWSVFRRDRYFDGSSTERGGGVMIVVRDSLSPTELSSTSNETEQLWISLSLGDKKCFIGCAYVPPKSSIEVYKKCWDEIELVLAMVRHEDEVLLLGDYNLPDVGWVEDDDIPLTYVPVHVSGTEATRFLDRIMSSGFYQLNWKVNRFGNVLDLVFSSSNSDINHRYPNSPFCRGIDKTIYHDPCVLELYGHFITPLTSILDTENEELDYRRADYTKIIEELCPIDWAAELNVQDVNQSTQRFLEIVYEVLSRHTPKRKRKRKRSRPWIDRNLARLKNARRNAARKAKATNDHQEFDVLDEIFVRENKKAYDEYAKRQADLLTSDPKQFWRFIDEKRKVKGYPDSMSFENISATGDQRASLFSSFFGRCFLSASRCGDRPDFQPASTVNVTLIPPVSVADVALLIRNLDSGKGAGPDGIPPLFYKMTSGVIAVPLSILFNKSIESCCFPDVWKVAHVVPVFKSGARTKVENYRCVSILSCAGKMLEQYVTRFLTTELQSILSCHQHAYLSGRSTVTNLAEYVSKIINFMEGGAQVDSVYTDFSKAFDTVPHHLLIAKLQRYGINGGAITWIQSYLSGRTQSVKLDGHKSLPVTVGSGVPQGSHIGPLLFAVFINDLIVKLDSSGVGCSAYADDLKLFIPVRSSSDCTKLQQAIDVVDDWCRLNGMQLNAAKCQLISFSRKRYTILNNYNVGDTPISRVSSVKDLGLFLDTKLLFNEHIDRISSRARSILGLVKRFAKELNDDRAVLSLYRALVRPIMEYAAAVWTPHCPTKMKRIESVQKQFVLWFLRHRYPIGVHRSRIPPYNVRLGECNLDSLEHRHKLHSIMLAHDCLNGYVSSLWLASKFTRNVPARTTRAPDFLSVAYHRTDYGKYEPVNYSRILYNKVAHLRNLYQGRGGFRRSAMSWLKSSDNGTVPTVS